jgi:hypothetical protein
VVSAASARTSGLRSADPVRRLRQPISGITGSELAVRPKPAGDRSGCARVARSMTEPAREVREVFFPTGG